MFFPSPSGGGVSSGSDYEQYSYDANGDITQDRRRDGQVISYSYDALNRATSTANGGTLAYDNFGRITSASRGGQTWSFAYDALGRKLSESNPLGTISSGYDAGGNRTSLTYPDGYVASYGYDATGALNAISDSSGAVAGYSYDNLGRLAGVSRSGGPGTALAYGSDLTLSALSHSFGDTTKNVSFSYASGPSGQLASATSSNSLYAYAVAKSATVAYTVDGQNKYTGVGGAAVASDARGNLTSDGTTGLTYTYDVADELTGVSSGAAQSFDALGRLWQTTTSAGAVTSFLYDGAQEVAEYVSGAVSNRYVASGVDQPMMVLPGTSTAASNREWLLADRQGSIVAIANATTTTAIDSNDEAGLLGKGGAGRFRYAGMPYIVATGLYHDRARDYDANLGRFLQSDPIGYGDGMNFYSYAHGDPVNGWDPSGLDTVSTVTVTANKPCPAGYTDAGTTYDQSGHGTRFCVHYTISNSFGDFLSSITSVTTNFPFFGGTPQGKSTSRNLVCSAVSKLPKGYGVYAGAQVTAVPGAGFSDAVQTTYVSNGQGGVTMTTTEQAFVGNGASIFAGATGGLIVPNLNFASASVPFGLGAFLPKGGITAALGLGGDIGSNNIGVSFGVGYVAGLLGQGNSNNSASHVLSSGGC